MGASGSYKKPGLGNVHAGRECRQLKLEAGTPHVPGCNGNADNKNHPNPSSGRGLLDACSPWDRGWVLTCVRDVADPIRGGRREAEDPFLTRSCF